MIKVLLVDDDEAVRSSALRCLATLDTELASAANGLLGLEKARQLRPDVIICDVDMPVMDGFELLEALRADPTLTSTLVMMLTAESSRDSMRLGMKLGADDYLTKPFTDAELLDAFDGLLRKRGRVETIVDSAVRDQEEQLRRMFGRSFDGGSSMDRFPPDAHELTASQNLVQASVLFSDIRNFTSIAEKLTAAEVAAMLTEYFERIYEPVLSNGGHYLKMMGDGLMAIFTEDSLAPMPPERRALFAAVSMAAAVREFALWVSSTYPDRGLPEFQVGFGVHCGEVAISQMGSATNKVATPIGDTVNIAARLESASKELGWTIVSSQTAASRAGPGLQAGARTLLTVRGKELPVEVVEILDLRVQPHEALDHDGFTRTIHLGQGDAAPQQAQPMPPRATLLADARSRLLADARQNADVAARAVKGALSSKLDSIKDHLFADVQGGGLRLAGYRILRRIGSGGMSSIYLATREADGILLVLKILDANRQDADQMARFVREYTLLASIDHPHIIRIFNQGFSDRHAYIAMEYFENGDLRSRMTGAMEPGEVVAIVLQVAQALSAIHALGIVHRDLKPENLMVRADGSIALADFGIAKALGPNTEVDPVLTQHGDIVGSPSYISPEQILGKPVTPRSDLYSLGVMLFEMLTGARPYQGSTLTTILALHTQAPPPELPTRLGHFQPIIDKLMAKDPAHRHESAEQLAQELRRLG